MKKNINNIKFVCRKLLRTNMKGGNHLKVNERSGDYASEGLA